MSTTGGNTKNTAHSETNLSAILNMLKQQAHKSQIEFNKLKAYTVIINDLLRHPDIAPRNAVREAEISIKN